MVIWDIESYDRCLELCDEHEECQEIDYNAKKEKCTHRSKVLFRLFSDNFETFTSEISGGIRKNPWS